MKLQPNLIALYDEDILRKEMLHNKLDHFGYSISFSCNTVKDLLINLKSYPGLLIINVEGQSKGILTKLKSIREINPEMKILVYLRTCPDSLKFKLNEATVHLFNNFVELIERLESLLPSHPMHASVAKISRNNPFYSILNDTKKFNILQLAANGKLTKEMPKIIGLEISTIETYRKQMIHEAKCKTMGELIAKAKDQKVI